MFWGRIANNVSVMRAPLVLLPLLIVTTAAAQRDLGLLGEPIPPLPADIVAAAEGKPIPCTHGVFRGFPAFTGVCVRAPYRSRVRLQAEIDKIFERHALPPSYASEWVAEFSASSKVWVWAARPDVLAVAVLFYGAYSARRIEFAVIWGWEPVDP